jgi:hypothetical protein
MKTIDPERPPRHVSVLAQDAPGGKFRLTRHAAEAEGKARFRDAPGVAVYESDDGQLVHRPRGIGPDEAERLIGAP